MKRVKSDSPVSASTENLRVKHDTPMKIRLQNEKLRS